MEAFFIESTNKRLFMNGDCSLIEGAGLATLFVPRQAGCERR